MNLFCKLYSTFLGIGYWPLAPGTAASAITVLLYKFVLARLEWPWYLLLLLALFCGGVFCSSRHASRTQKHDPRFIVIDEVVGQLLALFLLPAEWLPLLGSFLLFRFFDILKPLFIKKAETFPSGWGIMLDDLLAGIYSGIVVAVIMLLMN